MSLPAVSENTLLRIATLLASGLKATQVSSIIGVSPARIAQIQTSQEFIPIYEEKLAEAQKKDVEQAAIDAKYLSAEHLILDHVVQALPHADLREATQALKIVAERQDRASTRRNPIHASTVVHQNIVQLNLPTHALPEIVISAANEVMDVNGKNMAPLTSQGVESLFKSMKEKKHEQGRILEGAACPVEEAQESQLRLAL